MDVNVCGRSCLIHKKRGNDCMAEIKKSLNIPAGSSLYFIGIGGIGMSALARIFASMGHPVKGSDSVASTLTDELQKEGIEVFIGHDHDPQHIDFAIVSTAIRENNHELCWFRAQGIPCVHRGMLLAYLMNSRDSIAVTGTHGKTTTSALITYLLCEAGRSPIALVGGYLENYNSNVLVGDNSVVVAEVDESDKSHLYYSPRTTVVTNLELDHPDHYTDMQDMNNVFRSYFAGLAADALVVYCCDDPGINALASDMAGKTISYGVSPEAHFSAREIVCAGDETRFQVWREGVYVTDVVMSLLGHHNVLNVLASFAVVEHYGVDVCMAAALVGGFRGVKRRMDVLYEDTRCLVIDDYAHHPTEVRNVLRTLKEKKKKIIAVFQPHRYSRTKHLLHDFAAAFHDADVLIFTDTYSAGESVMAGVDIYALYDVAKDVFQGPCQVVHKDQLVMHMNTYTKNDTVFAFLGAGDITEYAHTFAVGLQNKSVKVKGV